MCIRPYHSPDYPALAELSHQTIYAVNARGYSPEQLDAWADGRVGLATWDASFRAHDTRATVEGDMIAGFADLGPDGCLDRLYIHRNRQGRGMVSAFCGALPAARITRASIATQPFFERRGWHMMKEQQVERRGVLLTNFVMERLCPPPSRPM